MPSAVGENDTLDEYQCVADDYNDDFARTRIIIYDDYVIIYYILYIILYYIIYICLKKIEN